MTLFWVIPQWKVLQKSHTFKESRNQSGEFLIAVVSRLPWNPIGRWELFLRNPRIAFRPIGKQMLYALYHAVIARNYIWVKQNVSFAHVWRNIKGQFLILANRSKSALAEHVWETSYNIAWDDSRIITTNNLMVNGFVWKTSILMRALVP